VQFFFWKQTTILLEKFPIQFSKIFLSDSIIWQKVIVIPGFWANTRNMEYLPAGFLSEQQTAAV
jgi:hypothetical protein